MRFRKGVHYPHPARGRARRPYHLSDAARRARRHNLSRWHVRSIRETAIIKLYIWQAFLAEGPRPSQRELARLLGVRPSYVCKIQKRVEEGLDVLARGELVTLDDVADARRFTAKLREQEPGLLAPAPR
jgi:hypothetical protein